MATILGKKVGQIGYGTMGLTWRSNPPPLAQAVQALKAASDAGCTVWSAAEFYGTPEYNSMTVMKAYFEKYPEDADRITIVVKGGGKDGSAMSVDGSNQNTRRSVDNIIAQLGGVKKLDAWATGRRDQNVPFAETLKLLKEEYIDTGKLGGVALSECRAETIYEAVKYTKVVAVEVELSMFSPDILTNGVTAACAEHDIPILAYSPIGRGILTGKLTTNAQFAEKGMAGHFPRFQDSAIEHNLTLVRQVQALAEKKGCTSAQLAVAWVRAVGGQKGMPQIVPIPGASAPERVWENAKAAEVALSQEEYQDIMGMVEAFTPAGGRYGAGIPTNT